jgi:Tol biopolymer transport system component
VSRPLLLSVLVTLLVGSMAGVSTASARADAGGYIAFMDEGVPWVVHPDGSDPHPVSGWPQGAIALSARWSPDTTRIVFSWQQLTDDNHYRSDVWVMNADGTGLIQVTNNRGNDRAGGWSPDGESVVFTSDRRDGEHFEVFVRRAVAPLGPTIRLTTTKGLRRNLSDGAPDWSPLGDAIVFTRAHMRNPEVDPRFQIRTVPVSGGTTHVVAHRLGCPRWAPDGSRIAALSMSGDSFFGPIVAMDLDGSEEVALPSSWPELQPTCPVWSPDGTEIAFGSWVEGTFGGLFTIDAGGTADPDPVAGGSTPMDWFA